VPSDLVTETAFGVTDAVGPLETKLRNSQLYRNAADASRVTATHWHIAWANLRRNTLMATFVASMALVSYSTVGYWMPLFLVQQHGWTTAEYGGIPDEWCDHATNPGRHR
jgi:hypothetical protein